MQSRLTITLTLVASVSFLQCSSSDEKSEGEKLCQQVDAKLAECSVTFGDGKCSAEGEVEMCLGRCVVNSTCEALVDDTAASSFTKCGFACQGAGSDWFICADGQKAIEPAGLCNGSFDCGDGSDEDSCADAGP